MRIVKISIQNKQLEGTVQELTLILRNEYKLTQQEIADLLGVTKACVSYHLIRNGQRGFLENTKYEFLTAELFEKETDEEISANYDLPIATVARIRRLRNVGRKQIISLERRRNLLALKLFGKKPGPNFKHFIENMKFESNLQKKIFDNFYLLGRRDTASNRAYRSKITDSIVIDLTMEQLIEKGIVDD